MRISTNSVPERDQPGHGPFGGGKGQSHGFGRACQAEPLPVPEKENDSP